MEVIMREYLRWLGLLQENTIDQVLKQDIYFS